MALDIAYKPGNISTNLETFPLQLQEELGRISAVLQVILASLPLDERNAAPNKIWDGMLVRADGTNWDPGSGQGVYCYYNSAWNFLG